MLPPPLKIKPESLAAHLRERLLPVYLISGDDPLLSAEAVDAVRLRARATGFTERDVHFMHSYWRLAPGVTVAHAQAEISAISHRLSEQYPDTERDRQRTLLSLREMVTGKVRPALLVLFGAVGFVDDYLKIRRKRNLGLRTMQKLLLEVLAALLVGILLLGMHAKGA